MAEVFLAQAGQLSAASKRELKKGGIIVVEVADLDQCRFVRASETISGDEMLWAAMDALSRSWQYDNQGAKQRERFAFNVHELLKAARPAKKEAES